MINYKTIDEAIIVTNRGMREDENIVNYIEDYEMFKNSEKLKKRYKKSSKSGKSSLII